MDVSRTVGNCPIDQMIELHEEVWEMLTEEQRQEFVGRHIAQIKELVENHAE